VSRPPAGAPKAASACGSQNAHSARQCLSVERRGQVRHPVNRCNRQAAAVWCYRGFDCRSGSRWWSSSWTIAGGSSYALHYNFTYDVEFNACCQTFCD
jgi:opacity protein-like surface antigen